MCILHLRICKYSEKSYLGVTTLWIAVYTDGVLRPYQFTNETGGGVGYYQMLDTYVRSEAQ